MRLDIVAHCLEDLQNNPFDIKKSKAHRDWMDETKDKFAYRCLPLTIANQYGWTLHCPAAFTAIWNGGSNNDDVLVKYDNIDETPYPFASSHFGSGTLTFNFNYIFRTSPGIDLYAKGPANCPKDGIAALEGIIETDWLPFTFTMNWLFTRPFTEIRFEKGEPFCTIFPVVRGLLEEFNTTIVPVSSSEEFKDQYQIYAKKRDLFNAGHYNDEIEETKRWQKFYFSGKDADGNLRTESHKTNVRHSDFELKSEIPPGANLSNKKRNKEKTSINHTEFTPGMLDNDINILEYESSNIIEPKSKKRKG